MPQTVILKGIENGYSKKTAEKHYKLIFTELEKMKTSENELNFSCFLSRLNLTFDEYIQAIRSSIKCGQSKLFLKRDLNEIRINSYNETLIKCWEANMDIQFILDPFACAAYIVSYISKGQRGMSNLLNEACRASRKSDCDIRQQVRSIGNVFLSHVEVGAQEAVYLILQMPLRRSSRQVVFVNTNSEENRISLIKSEADLKELPKDSTDVECDNQIKRYQRRPKAMEHYCLADYIACFDIQCKQKKNTSSPNYNMEFLPEIDDGDDDADSEFHIHMKNISNNTLKYDREKHFGHDGSILSRRKKPKVIYSAAFNKDTQKEDHYREQIMLYFPWRNESNILGSFTLFEEHYNSVVEVIERNKKKYIGLSTEDNIALLDLDMEDVLDASIVPEELHINAQDYEEGISVSTDHEFFNPGKNQTFSTYDIGVEFGISRKFISNEETIHGEMMDTDYRKMVQMLNKKQKEFFYHVLHWHKANKGPLYNFLSGGIGVGKSLLLRALYQALRKYFSHQAGSNPDDISILICAPTGKAAFNVGGLTIHSAFNIPPEQGFRYKPLDMQQLNTFQIKYRHLKVVFIDEISMVGQNMFNFINTRLQEIVRYYTTIWWYFCHCIW